MLEIQTIYSSLLNTSITVLEMDELTRIGDVYYSVFYDAEEPTRTKYNLVMTIPLSCIEHHNKFLTSTPQNLSNHFIVIQRYKQFHKKWVALDIASFIYDYCLYGYYPRNSYMSFLRSCHLLRQPNYIKPEIAECIYLPSGECVAIKKTFWLSIIQRTWKNIYKKRLDILNKYTQPSELYYWRTHGKWSSYLPSLCGMLRNLRPSKSSGV